MVPRPVLPEEIPGFPVLHGVLVGDQFVEELDDLVAADLQVLQRDVEDEVVAPDMAHEASGSQGADHVPENPGGQIDDRVPAIVAVSVVELFEMVQVGVAHGERGPRRPFALPGPARSERFPEAASSGEHSRPERLAEEPTPAAETFFLRDQVAHHLIGSGLQACWPGVPHPSARSETKTTVGTMEVKASPFRAAQSSRTTSDSIRCVEDQAGWEGTVQKGKNLFPGAPPPGCPSRGPRRTAE